MQGSKRVYTALRVWYVCVSCVRPLRTTHDVDVWTCAFDSKVYSLHMGHGTFTHFECVCALWTLECPDLVARSAVATTSHEPLPTLAFEDEAR